MRARRSHQIGIGMVRKKEWVWKWVWWERVAVWGEREIGFCERVRERRCERGEGEMM